MELGTMEVEGKDTSLEGVICMHRLFSLVLGLTLSLGTTAAASVQPAPRNAMTPATTGAAQQTWKVKPGGPITATFPAPVTATLKDAAAGNFTITCTQSMLNGKLDPAPDGGLAGPEIGKVSTLEFGTAPGKCTAADGGYTVTVTLPAAGASINATGYTAKTMTTSGTINNVQFSLVHRRLIGKNCTATIDGPPAGGARSGVLDFTFGDGNQLLTLSSNNLQVTKADHCGAIVAGQAITLSDTLDLNPPKQTIEQVPAKCPPGGKASTPSSQLARPVSTMPPAKGKYKQAFRPIPPNGISNAAGQFQDRDWNAQRRDPADPAPGVAQAGWTVLPGCAVSASGSGQVKDKKTGTIAKCTSIKMSATLKTGSGNPGKGLGSITSGTFSGCSISGISVTVVTQGLPWHLNAVSYNSTTGVTSGNISGLILVATAPGCSATLEGKTVGIPGTVNVSYNNSTGVLKLLGSGGTLTAQNVSGCLGLVNDGDAQAASGSLTVSPKQTITSP